MIPNKAELTVLDAVSRVKGNLPQELKETGMFCMWKYEDREGKLSKVPYNPRTGGHAMSDKKNTFAPLDVAINAFDNSYSGVGIGVFDDIAGIDIDHCIEEDGKLSPMAQDIVEKMQAYVEVSPSGTGLRILFKVSKSFKYDVDRYYIKNTNRGLEVYVAGITNRFLTVTGNTLCKCGMIDRTKELQGVLNKYMLRTPNLCTGTRSGSPNGANSLDDDELLDKARNAKNGDKFARLFNGDWSHYGYDSQSEAEVALCILLAFWSNGNPEQMDRLFRQSGLLRNKWDSKRRGTTYGQITILKAIDYCADWYSPQGEKTMTDNHTDILSCLKPVSSYEAKEAEWLVDGYIPKYGITLLGGDGGSGKTFVWCNIAAAISNGYMPELFTDGKRVMLNENTSCKVLYFSGEDSVEYVIRQRLEAAGANLNNIHTIDVSNPNFTKLKFNSAEMKELIIAMRPSLVIFDPIQSFVDSNIKMGERNAMRQALMPLNEYAQTCGTAFLLIMHTNKRAGAYGRNRFSDSSDIFDFSRSALIVGNTGEDGIQYMSHEKSNYGKMRKTILYEIRGSQIVYGGTTNRKDKDYITSFSEKRISPQKREASDFILDYLEKHGQSEIKDLRSKAIAAGHSNNAFENAKKELIDKGIIESVNSSKGKAKGVTHYLKLV